MRSWEREFVIAVEIRPADRFLCTPEQFTDWAKDRKQLRMEYFYREMRKKYDILMHQVQPLGEPWMYDSHISFYLNCGLLLPLECVQVAEKAYQQGKVELNAVEGFIRRIAWREYVRGIYWLKRPEYGAENFLQANRHLPDLLLDS